MNNSENEVLESTAMILQEYINPNTVHKDYGFSISTLAKWRMKNLHLNFYKMGKYIKYKRSEIIEFIESHKIVKVA